MIEFECFYKMINYKNISRTLQIIRMFKRMSLTASNKFQAMVKLIPLIPIADYLKKYIDRGLRPATLLKKRLWHRCFPVNFVKFLRTPFLQNASGRLLLKEFLESIQISMVHIYQVFF